MATMTVRAKVEITAHDLVSELNREALIDLIKDIDEHTADWEFTEKLYKHFSQLHESYLEEKALDEKGPRTVGDGVHVHAEQLHNYNTCVCGKVLDK